MKKPELYLTYDDVLLIPQYSTITSRKLVDTKTKFSKNISLNIPIVSANMDTVTGADMAIAVASSGGIGIIHRFLTIENQVSEVKKVKESNKNFLVAGAIGLKNGEERAQVLINAGCNALVLDVAHGHHELVINLLKLLKKKFKNIDIVAGNIATVEGAKDLIRAGADAIKVGIGPGSACSTRIISGSGIPQFSALQEITPIAKKYKIPVIADGGIKNSGDIAKALGAGADTVMIGNLFAGTLESPGECFEENGKTYKIYRGMASREASFNRPKNEALDRNNRVPEGVSFKVNYKGEVTPIINSLVQGLQSGMSYSGAKNIIEFHKKAKFVRMTNTGMEESHPRVNQI